MIKCSICGEQVELRKENRYEVVVEEGALRKSFGFKDRLYEAFDCPHCGCQMLMNERFPVKNEIKIAEERTDEHNGCCVESDDDAEDTKTSEQKKVAVRSRFADCKCDVIETEWKDDDGAPVEGIRDKLQSFGGKVKITYGSENREADDVTLDYLQKMSDDELLAFCGENDIRIPEAYHNNRGYLISIIKKHCLV